MRNDVTRANAVSERKKSFKNFDFFSFEKRKIPSDHETKKQSRTCPDEQIKEFSLNKRQTRPSTDYDTIGKTVSKKFR